MTKKEIPKANEQLKKMKKIYDKLPLDVKKSMPTHLEWDWPTIGGPKVKRNVEKIKEIWSKLKFEAIEVNPMNLLSENIGFVQKPITWKAKWSDMLGGRTEEYHATMQLISPLFKDKIIIYPGSYNDFGIVKHWNAKEFHFIDPRFDANVDEITAQDIEKIKKNDEWKREAKLHPNMIKKINNEWVMEQPITKKISKIPKADVLFKKCSNIDSEFFFDYITNNKPEIIVDYDLSTEIPKEYEEITDKALGDLATLLKEINEKVEQTPIVRIYKLKK